MNIIGLLLIFITGIFWCANGIVFSYTARKSMDFVVIVAIQASLSAVGAWLFLSNPQLLLTENIPRLGQLGAVMISSGMVCALGLISMQKAMKIGHHGVVYTISQSAMIIPFLFGVLIFGENITSYKIMGLIFVLLSFMVFGRGQPNNEINQKNASVNYWFFIAVFAFFVFGLHQCLSTVPSYWENWIDTANLRVPLLLTGIALGFLLSMVIQKKIPDKKTLKFGIMICPLGLPCQITFFKAMDLFAENNMVSVVYPLAVGTNIIAFTIYSMFLIREKTTRLSIWGVVVGITGLMLISF